MRSQEIRKEILRILYEKRSKDFVSIKDLINLSPISDECLDTEIKYLDDKNLVSILGKNVGREFLNFAGVKITASGIDLIESQENISNYNLSKDINNGKNHLKNDGNQPSEFLKKFFNIEKLEIIKGDKIEHGIKNEFKNNKENSSGGKKLIIITGVIVPILVAIIGSPVWVPFLQNKENKQSVQTINGWNGSLLRSLQPLETGKKIWQLPNGVYFFSLAASIISEINDPKLDFLSASSKRYENYSFEIQKIENRYYLIGFISDENYANIGSVNSEKTLYCMLFPNKWGGITNSIAIPFDKIYTIKSRIINMDEKKEMEVFDIGFKEVEANPEIHID